MYKAKGIDFIKFERSIDEKYWLKIFPLYLSLFLTRLFYLILEEKQENIIKKTMGMGDFYTETIG